jgi:hypothetical protein
LRLPFLSSLPTHVLLVLFDVEVAVPLAFLSFLLVQAIPLLLLPFSFLSLCYINASVRFRRFALFLFAPLSCRAFSSFFTA